jgi:uncharacterized protein
MAPLGDIPDPPPSRASRYGATPLPPYRYVPGLHPHPTRDPRGHSYEPEAKLNRHAPWRPADWRQLEAWLYGVDLFNAFYFWEAHEAWEGLWAAVERGNTPSLMLQGLIQLAAALLKTHMSSVAGAHVLAREGLDKLRRAAAESPRFMGVDLGFVIRAFAEYFAPLAVGVLPDVAAAPVLKLCFD